MSRIIKSQWAASAAEEKKIISIVRFHQLNEDEQSEVQPTDILQRNTEEERTLIVEEANREAEAIIANANTLIREMHAQLEQDKLAWQTELVSLTEQVKQEGFDAGFKLGQKQGYDELEELIEAAKQVVSASKIDYQKKIESADDTILQIGLKVAERIVGQHLEGNSERFMPVVQRALKEAREYREVQLHVHPEHYEFLLEHKDELVRIFPKETELYIYPDSDLSEMGCIIESASGRIDASVDTQLEEIKRILFEMLESE